MDGAEQEPHLLSAQHGGDPLGPPRPDEPLELARRPAEHLAIQEEERGQGLGLGGRAHSAQLRQVGQEALDLGLAQLVGVAEVVVAD